MLRDPVRVLRSSPVRDPLIDACLMKRENTNQPVQEIKNNKHGGSLVAPEEGAVVKVVAQTPVFLGHVGTSNLNDNYRVCPTSVQIVNYRLDKSVYPDPIQTVNPSLLDSLIVPKDSNIKVHQDVSYSVADHVHSVKCRRHPQKKGLSCVKEQNKRCKKCFLGKSMCFCPACSQCPQCCSRSSCRGQVGKFLAEMAKSRDKSKGGLNFERGLHASLQNEATSHKVTSGLEWLCKPSQERAPKRGIAGSDAKVGSGKSGCPVLPSCLQLVIPGTKTKQQVEADFGPESAKSVPLHRNFQNGDPGNNLTVTSKRGVGNLAELQQCVLSHPHPTKVKKIPAFFPKRTDLPVHCPPVWSGNSPPRVYKSGQGSEAHSTSKGYSDPPVPR